MEQHIEKLLVVLMNKVVEGIPDGKGGYLEQPIERDASRFLVECGGELDEAVAAAAHDIFVKKANWSQSVWRGALLVVVGQVPVLGSTAAVFCSQFESVWRQIRFISLAATIYGHDVREDATQCQVILCLLDEKILRRTGPSAMDELYRKGVKSGIQVAATVIVRQGVTKGGASFMMKRVLGGLLSGGVPDAVGLIYTLCWTGGSLSNEEEVAAHARALGERGRQHFKREEQPSLALVVAAFLVWFLPVLLLNTAKAWTAYDAVLARAVRTLRSPALKLAAARFAAWLLGGVPSAVSDLVPCAETAAAPVVLTAKIVFIALVVLVLCRLALFIARQQTWLVAATALGIRALLKFVSARNTAVSIAMAFAYWQPDAPYHAHRAAVGLFMIAARRFKSLKPMIPFVISSLLLWLVFNVAVCATVYVRAFVPVLSNAQSDGHALDKALAEIAEVNDELVKTGFAWARLKDAIDATCSTALFVLLEEIRRPDVVMSIVGPKKVVDGLLFAAKSLGHVVSSPNTVLVWLDRTTPPFTVSWALLAMQNCATPLGLFCGFAYYVEAISALELGLLCYGVLVSVPFVLWQRPLPPPHNNTVWADALRARHRLLFLVPELDSGFRTRLCFAIEFFESYSLARSQTKIIAVSQFGKVKDWIVLSFSRPKKRDVLEANDLVEFDASVYQDPNVSWFRAVSERFWKAVAPRAALREAYAEEELGELDYDDDGCPSPTGSQPGWRAWAVAKLRGGGGDTVPEAVALTALELSSLDNAAVVSATVAQAGDTEPAGKVEEDADRSQGWFSGWRRPNRGPQDADEGGLAEKSSSENEREHAGATEGAAGLASEGWLARIRKASAVGRTGSDAPCFADGQSVDEVGSLAINDPSLPKPGEARPTGSAVETVSALEPSADEQGGESPQAWCARGATSPDDPRLPEDTRTTRDAQANRAANGVQAEELNGDQSDQRPFSRQRAPTTNESNVSGKSDENASVRRCSSQNDNRWFSNWRGPPQQESDTCRETLDDQPDDVDSEKDNRWFSRWRGPPQQESNVQDDSRGEALDDQPDDVDSEKDNRWFARWRGPPQQESNVQDDSCRETLDDQPDDVDSEKDNRWFSKWRGPPQQQDDSCKENPDPSGEGLQAAASAGWLTKFLLHGSGEVSKPCDVEESSSGGPRANGEWFARWRSAPSQTESAGMDVSGAGGNNDNAMDEPACAGTQRSEPKGLGRQPSAASSEADVTTSAECLDQAGLARVESATSLEGGTTWAAGLDSAAEALQDVSTIRVSASPHVALPDSTHEPKGQAAQDEIESDEG